MTAKTTLKDVTFVTMARLDSMVRLENLIMVVDFLLTHFDTRIHILEAAGYNNHILERLLPKQVSVRFIEDHDPIFHRTRYLNQCVKNCHTPWVALWDADVIVPPEQVIQSVECLREQETHFVFPYGNQFLDTSNILRELYWTTRNLDLLKENTGKMTPLYGTSPVGGSLFACKSAYIRSGMENEYYYGWGRHDGDRLNRWKIMGYQHKRIPGPLFHLTHERGFNSKFHTEEQNQIKMSEIYRIAAMSKEELEEEVRSWR